MNKTIEILERYNAWRRSNLPVFDGGEMPCHKELELAIDDAVSKLRAMEWRPIDTLALAHDGMELLGYDGQFVYMARVCLDRNCVVDAYDQCQEWTHWMPLPAPPAC